MSSDLLDINADDRNVDIGLEVKASSHAWLTLSGEDEYCMYHLTPDDDGWSKAEAIVEALQEWIRHSKSLKEIK